ncbi:protein kinase [Helicosporidium sp. ATCC 50920]|nr:protein kinase [Helicosporidium sp. ATCC 50920]|eukprot:KDD76548.1 protein kinase [Helicosporidium sp. ATCC 50920]
MPNLAVGTVLGNGKYRVLREINRGGTAVVYECETLPDGLPHVALKVMSAREGRASMPIRGVRREIEYTASVQHENVVQLIDFFVEDAHAVIVWELICGPDLLDLLNERGGRLKEPEAAFYFRQLLRGVRFIHERGLCHRDLKPENVMIDRTSQRVKIIDFGLSKRQASAVTLGVGTPDYMAPELLGNGSVATLYERQTGVYDAQAIDIWALGVMLYLLVTGLYPFEDPLHPQNVVATLQNIMHGRMRPLPRRVSRACAALIHAMLEPRPNARIGLAAVARHPWLAAGGDPALADAALERQEQLGEDAGAAELSPDSPDKRDEGRGWPPRINAAPRAPSTPPKLASGSASPASAARDSLGPPGNWGPLESSYAAGLTPQRAAPPAPLTADEQQFRLTARFGAGDDRADALAALHGVGSRVPPPLRSSLEAGDGFEASLKLGGAGDRACEVQTYHLTTPCEQLYAPEPYSSAFAFAEGATLVASTRSDDCLYMEPSPYSNAIGLPLASFDPPPPCVDPFRGFVLDRQAMRSDTVQARRSFSFDEQGQRALAPRPTPILGCHRSQGDEVPAPPRLGLGKADSFRTHGMSSSSLRTTPCSLRGCTPSPYAPAHLSPSIAEDSAGFGDSSGLDLKYSSESERSVRMDRTHSDSEAELRLGGARNGRLLDHLPAPRKVSPSLQPPHSPSMQPRAQDRDEMTRLWTGPEFAQAPRPSGAAAAPAPSVPDSRADQETKRLRLGSLCRAWFGNAAAPFHRCDA